jgi:hypothetical protein
MPVVIGPVLKRDTGYAFDSWSPGDGFHRGYIYRRVEDAYHARKFELKARDRGPVEQMVTCTTLDDFVTRTTGLQN